MMKDLRQLTLEFELHLSECNASQVIATHHKCTKVVAKWCRESANVSSLTVIANPFGQGLGHAASIS